MNLPHNDYNNFTVPPLPANQNTRFPPASSIQVMASLKIHILVPDRYWLDFSCTSELKSKGFSTSLNSSRGRVTTKSRFLVDSLLIFVVIFDFAMYPVYPGVDSSDFDCSEV